MKSFYEPTVEAIQELEKPWIAAFSGGKDSTSMVTWIEWLRRSGQIFVKEPKLVQSDTMVEYPFLQDVSERMLKTLHDSGWQIKSVTPEIRNRLYPSIFGRGVPPVHPSMVKKMRWCTRATKIDPMKGYGKSVGDNVIMLTGLRWGESQTRDGKLEAAGCSAGGECGTNFQANAGLGVKVFSPIINWKTCSVIDWLSGMVDRTVTDVIKDLLPVMKELTKIYDLKQGQIGLLGLRFPPPKALRFGCVGCPAIAKDRVAEKESRKDPRYESVKKIYRIWYEFRKPENRVGKVRENGSWKQGPIRMEARKKWFEVFLEIQRESGIILVRPEEETFIRQCWVDSVYPRGWCPEDENNEPPPFHFRFGLPVVGP